MLISFIGSPCSGKSTTSAQLLGKLKETGLPVEGLQEEARLIIAEKRMVYEDQGKEFTSSCLTDDDQWNIMLTQARREAILNRSLLKVPMSLVVSDTSSLNSLLYMSPERRAAPEVRALTRQLVDSSCLIFYSKPVDMPAYVKGLDPNRVHDSKQSQAIDEAIPDLLKSWGVDSYVMLTGSIEARLARAFQSVNAHLKILTAQAIKADERAKAVAAASAVGVSVRT